MGIGGGGGGSSRLDPRLPASLSQSGGRQRPGHYHIYKPTQGPAAGNKQQVVLSTTRGKQGGERLTVDPLFVDFSNFLLLHFIFPDDAPRDHRGGTPVGHVTVTSHTLPGGVYIQSTGGVTH